MDPVQFDQLIDVVLSCTAVLFGGLMALVVAVTWKG